KPTDLMGRKGGAPSVDATYRLFDVFARVNGIDPSRVQWTTVQPQVREPLLVRGEIDFAAAWVMTAVPSLIGLGVKRDDINVMMLRDHGLDLYANAVFTTPAFAKQHPDAVRGFVKATVQSWQNAAADPDAAVAALKRTEPLSDPAVELGRLKAALEFVVTPGVRKTGIGHVDPARLAKHIDIVTDGFGLPRKLPPEMVFDSSFLPPAAERQIGRGPLVPCRGRQSFGKWSKEPVGVDRCGVGARRQLVCANDRLDRAFELLRRDRAQPVLLYVRRVSEPERDIEPHLLDVELHHGIVRLEELERLLWRRNCVFGAPVERLDDAAHRFRVLVGELLRSHQRQPVHIGAEIGVLDHEQIVHREPKLERG